MRVAIIGGTGTLGKALVRALEYPAHEISVFSRCELKQKEMAKEIAPRNIHYTLGDIRDRDAVMKFFRRNDFEAVYHVAALKHVDTLEQNPEESVKTNILGTINVADACEESGVPLCVFSSTDKAVDPINAYGMSKGIAERILYERNEAGSPTRYAVFRWGNVVASRGSVIPVWIDALKTGKPLNVTDPEMTRFWITVDSAVQFMITGQKSAPASFAAIPEMRAASIREVIHALSDLVGIGVTEINTIGNRGGEKAHEYLRSQHSPDPISSLSAPRYSSDGLKEMLRPFVEAAT